MSAKLKCAVLGASGYSGLELTRILDRHPRLEKPLLLRREGSEGATDLAQVFPELSGNGGEFFRQLSWARLIRHGVCSCFFWRRRMRHQERLCRKPLRKDYASST